MVKGAADCRLRPWASARAWRDPDADVLRSQLCVLVATGEDRVGAVALSMTQACRRDWRPLLKQFIGTVL